MLNQMPVGDTADILNIEAGLLVACMHATPNCQAPRHEGWVWVLEPPRRDQA